MNTNNFMFSPRPPLPPLPAREVVSAFSIKEPLDLNRNFTNNYIASQLFIRKDSEVSTQSYMEIRPDYLNVTAEKPSTPNPYKDSPLAFNYEKEYGRLMGKYKKK